MILVQAKDAEEWNAASQMLHRTVKHLEKIGRSLWTTKQIAAHALENAYQLCDLYFLSVDGKRIGLVFLQQSDLLFWPEIKALDSLFIHKLALEPFYIGDGYGARAIEVIAAEASRRGCSWLRLDCDDRPELHRFYLGCGFKLVDIKQVESFCVARYQRSI